MFTKESRCMPPGAQRGQRCRVLHVPNEVHLLYISFAYTANITHKSTRLHIKSHSSRFTQPINKCNFSSESSHVASSSRNQEESVDEEQENSEPSGRSSRVSRRKSNDECIRPEARRRALTDTHMMRSIRQLDTICTIGGYFIHVSNKTQVQTRRYVYDCWSQSHYSGVYSSLE